MLQPFVAYVTPRDGIPRRLTLAAACQDTARAAAVRQARALFPGQPLAVCVWAA